MTDNWNDEQPIYRQLRDRVAGLILSGDFTEEEAIPSVRQVSAQYQINHLTVAKAYQTLVDEGVLEMRRGRGMFVLNGARKRLLRDERSKFEDEELPEFVARAKQLGIPLDELQVLIEKADNQQKQKRG